MKLFFIIWFLILSVGFSWAQNSSFNPNFDLESLSGIQVNDIKQDSLGFLWVGTNEGLYRYDGYSLKLYYSYPASIGSTIVHEIFIDGNQQLWVGTYGGLLKYNKQSDQFVTLKHDSTDRSSIRTNRINAITEDQAGNLWLGLSNGGIDLYKKKENKFYHFVVADKTGLSSDDINDLHVDKNNVLWISTWNHGLNSLDLNRSENTTPATARFRAFRTTNRSMISQLCMFQDESSENIYLGSSTHELLWFNKRSETLKAVPIEDLKGNSVNNAWLLPDNKILAATLTGVRVVNLTDRSVEDCAAPMCQITNTVYVVYKDNQNITWLGTDDGLKKYVDKKVQHIKLDPLKSNHVKNNIIALCKQGQYIWLGTWGDGLYLKDQISGKSLKVNADNKSLTSIWDIKLVNDKMLLVGTCNGLVILDVSNFSFRNSFKEDNHLGQYYFTSLTKNTTGPTWAGTWRGGIYKIDSETGEITKLEKYDIDTHFIQALYYGEDDVLWVGTVHAGLVRLGNVSGNLNSKIYSQQSSDLSGDFVSALYEDKEQKLWIGTSGGGINILDLKTHKMEWIQKGERNLQSSTIRGIIQDQRGDMWVTFKSGVSKLHKNGMFINYTEDDGFENLAFNPNSVLKDGNNLYFGTQEGYNVFDPEDLVFQKDPSKIYITDFKIFDTSIAPRQVYEGNVILPKPINELETVSLSYKVKNISFEFSALNFINAKREIFAYMLEGFDEHWIYTNASNRRVSYSNLSPGNYTLRIKTARNSTVNELQGRTLNIVVVPPIWQTTWFIIVASLALVAILYLAHWIRLRSLRKQKLLFESLANERVKVIEMKNNQLEQQNIEIQNQAAKLHEADQSKINFFANISHEFRTPLMLIVGPIAKLIENGEFSGNESLAMIHRNSKRLLRLIDQIMDFSKIEAGSLKLEVASGDFVLFVKDIIASFNYLAQSKNIVVEFYSEEDECEFNFDHDKVEKIIYNLLSNAFKVTPPSGRVAVTLEMVPGTSPQSLNTIRLEIFNSGKGINKSELPNLFTRFYRTKSYTDGTGIGLSLTKSLVELHGGTIDVKSEENEGTWFCVVLPVDRAALPIKSDTEDSQEFQKPAIVSQPVEVHHPSDTAPFTGQKHEKTILILDDDEDMRIFIKNLLSPLYNVVDSSNGEDALKLAYQFQPDLIVSDMMMPVMDGYQFLRLVKSDSNISHIPIILLTARASLDARLKGLEEGADDYITKPFHEKLLLLRVKNLIDRMQRAKQRFSTDINLEPKEITITSLDEKFMKGLLEVVEKNMGNPNFGADTICQELGVGRSYLYAKVKALTDLPVNEFVKTIRLKRAAVLLVKGQLHVNEVAYNVGFNDRYYFTKCFVKQFGISPSQYHAENALVKPTVHSE